MIGKTVSHYRILDKLGEGGMGVVYKAEDTKLKRFVALKFLPPELTRDPEAKARFIHEAQAASALDHPNICTIYEIDETADGQLYICMACYEGVTLQEKIRQGPLPVEEALDISLQLGRGLDRAHESEIVHRDIKPANVLITTRGEAKILDFGLAKLAGQTRLTRAGTTVGTVAYMSPEQTRGRAVDHRTDIWSLGVVLYEMLTGVLPFGGEYEQAVMFSIVNEEPRPIDTLRPGLPDDLKRIIEKALSKVTEGRYQTAGALVNDLSEFNERLKMPAARSTRAAGRGAPSRGRRRFGVYGMLSILIVVLGAYLILTRFVGPERSKGPPGEPSGSETVSLAPSGLTAARYEKSIVVLPFDDISPGRDNEYFSDGLTEEIIADLSKVHALRVISRTSAMKLKGTDKNVQDIGRELNVQYVLEGSVRKAGTDLRITAQLIDATNDAHLWAEKYTGTLDDVFDMQEKVSRAIVDALKMKLSPEEDRRIAQRPIENARAYEYYLRARKDIFLYTEDALERALQYLRKGIDIVGDNPLLHAGVGYVHWQYINAGISMNEAHLDTVEQCANRCFELEPNSSYGHFLLGVLESTRGNYRQSIRHLRQVLAQDPNDSEAIRWLVVVYSFVGKASDASEMAEALVLMDPLGEAYTPSWARWAEGRFEEAAALVEDVYEKDPDNRVLALYYGLVLAYNRRFGEASVLIDRFAEDGRGDYLERLSLFMKYAWEGKRVEATGIMTPDFEAKTRRDVQYSGFVAGGYALLGDKEKAMDWVEHSVNRGFINYPYLNEIDPFLESVRGEKRFKELMRRVKYEWEHFEI